MIKIECSIGEIIDKITILIIKKNKIKNKNKLINIEKELEILHNTIVNKWHYKDSKYFIDLLSVNLTLWKIEDDIRDKERNFIFDDNFISIARSVYIMNDKRCLIKTEINNLKNSNLKEEKSYTDLNYNSCLENKTKLNDLTNNYLSSLKKKVDIELETFKY